MISIQRGDIITLKLVGGDEVVGRFDALEEVGVVIENPKLLVVNQAGAGAIMPYVASLQEQKFIVISRMAIVTMGKTDKALADNIRASMSGLQMPAKGGLIV